MVSGLDFLSETSQQRRTKFITAYTSFLKNDKVKNMTLENKKPLKHTKLTARFSTPLGHCEVSSRSTPLGLLAT